MQDSNGDPSVHIVTQIVNSLLCLLIFPWEREIKDSDKNKKSQAIKDLRDKKLNHQDLALLPEWETVAGAWKPVTLSDLMVAIRNSVAHGSICFSSASLDPNEVWLYVTKLQYQNKCSCCGQSSFKDGPTGVLWKGRIRVSRLKDFAFLIAKEMEKVIPEEELGDCNELNIHGHLSGEEVLA